MSLSSDGVETVLAVIVGDAEVLVTGVADVLPLTDATREIFASTRRGESVYYGWPAPLTTRCCPAERAGAKKTSFEVILAPPIMPLRITEPAV
jgi:hypothetical protein